MNNDLANKTAFIEGGGGSRSAGQRMKKILVNLLCAFVWGKDTRHKIRERFLYSVPSAKRYAEEIHSHIEDVYQRLKFEIDKNAYLTRMDFAAAQLHPKTFGKYKNAFNGRDAVLVATGPSLDYYKPIEGAIHVGVNAAFKCDKVKLDYLFMCDNTTTLDYIEQAKDYGAIKFYGIVRHYFEINGRSPIMPESIAIDHNASRFYENATLDDKIMENLDFVYDITAHPLTNYSSIVFPAMQFILWGNPKRVYLVGCDASQSGHFYDEKNNELNQALIINSTFLNIIKNGWQKTKDFAKHHYPETEIISINPVGLRGLFTDLDQLESEAL